MFEQLKYKMAKKRKAKEDAADIITDYRIGMSEDKFSHVFYVKTTKCADWREIYRGYSDKYFPSYESYVKGMSYIQARGAMMSDKLYNPLDEIEALIQRFLVDGDPNSFNTERLSVRDKKHSIDVDIAEVEFWPGLELTRHEVKEFLYPNGSLNQKRLDQLRGSSIGVDVNVTSRQYIEVYRHSHNPRRLYLN